MQIDHCKEFLSWHFECWPFVRHLNFHDFHFYSPCIKESFSLLNFLLQMLVKNLKELKSGLSHLWGQEVEKIEWTEFELCILFQYFLKILLWCNNNKIQTWTHHKHPECEGCKKTRTWYKISVLIMIRNYKKVYYLLKKSVMHKLNVFLHLQKGLPRILRMEAKPEQRNAVVSVSV